MNALPTLLLGALCTTPLFGSNDHDDHDDHSDLTNTVVLNETGVQNLRLETEVVKSADFAETIFALGRIDVYPGNRAILSSRIAGRADQVLIQHDHPIRKGEIAVVVESRQVGDPPPRIKVSAPLSGLISAVHVVPGQPISPDDNLGEILDLSKVYAIARVPEQLAHRIARGQQAELNVTAASDKNFSARLEHLGALADPVSGTVEAAFHVDNPDDVLRPGMRVEFSIEVSRRPNVMSIPRATLQGTPADRFVYVKHHEIPHAFVKSPVVVGKSNANRIEILSGLDAGAEVVTRGAYSLAFSGGNSASLRDALDAAHGHEHNPDGSEIGSDGDEHGHDDHDNHGHDDHGSHENEDPFWKIVSGVLFVAVIVISFIKTPKS